MFQGSLTPCSGVAWEEKILSVPLSANQGKYVSVSYQLATMKMPEAERMSRGTDHGQKIITPTLTIQRDSVVLLHSLHGIDIPGVDDIGCPQGAPTLVVVHLRLQQVTKLREELLAKGIHNRSGDSGLWTIRHFSTTSLMLCRLVLRLFCFPYLFIQGFSKFLKFRKGSIVRMQVNWCTTDSNLTWLWSPPFRLDVN